MCGKTKGMKLPGGEWGGRERRERERDSTM